MKTKKIFALSVAALFLACGEPGAEPNAQSDFGSSLFASKAGSAQGSFFASKAGMTLTARQDDAKGNVQGYSVLTIKDVKGSGGNMDITYSLAILDKNRKPLKSLSGDQIFKATVKDNVVTMDLNQMIPDEMKDQGAKIEIKGTPLELPSDLKPGQELKASNVTMTMDFGVMKMSAVVKSEGKCVAIEDVKVPAGTFRCHKVAQKTTTNVMNTTNVVNTVSWYAPNIGTVKSENYDKGNRLVSSTVLVEVKGK